MKNTIRNARFTAILLCITTVFALFTGSVYAGDNGITYIDETTIVIEDGKIISGDKSLIDKGIIVVGDEDSSDETDSKDESDDGDNSDKVTSEESADETNPSSGKAPVKDNSDLINPDSSTCETQSGVSLPTVTPKYVAPTTGFTDSQVRALRASGSYNVANNWVGTDLQLMVTHVTRYMNSASTTYTMNIPILARGWAGGDAAFTSSGNSYVTFNKELYYVNNGTLNITHTGSSNGGNTTLEGLRLYYQNYTSVDNTGTDNDYYYIGANNADTATRWSNSTAGTFPSNQVAWDLAPASYPFEPLIRVTGGTANVYDDSGRVYIQNNLSNEGGGAVRVTGGEVKLTNTTIRHCKANGAGGGIYIGASGTAVLNNVIIDNCHASTNGGGIYVASGGKLTMSNTTIQNCTAAHGGAIYLAGNCNVTLNSVTIQNNTATTNGGAIWMGPTVTINHTGGTISGNTAGGVGGAIAMARHCTYNLQGGTISGNTAKNGGAIGCYGDGTSNTGSPDFNMYSGAISNNTATVNGGAIHIRCGDGHSISGGTISGNKAPQGAGIYMYNNSAGYPGTAASKITISGSANITSNNNSVITHGGAAYVESGTLVMSGGTMQNNSATTDGGNICCYGGTVSITGGTITTGSANQGGGLYVKSPGSITMSGGKVTSNSKGGGVFVYAAGNFTLSGSGEISSNTPCAGYPGGGVVIYNNSGGKFTMTGGTIKSHTGANGHGVAQTGNGGEIAISGGTISGNTPSGNGGGVYVTAGTFKMSGSATITGNTSTNNGGGVYSNAGNVNITGGTISGNTAASQGGGIYLANSTGIATSGTDPVIISGKTTIHNNTATSDRGGGILTTTTDLSINGATISENKAPNVTNGLGGGIYFNTANKTLSLENCNITKNESGNRGGGLYATGTVTVSITGSVFDGNSSKTEGGAIDLYSGAVATVTNTYLGNNTATKGGGAISLTPNNVAATKLTLDNSHIGVLLKDGVEVEARNSAPIGGGIYAKTSTAVYSVVIGNSNISNNSATGGDGGGIHISSGCSLTINSGVNISDNTASGNGGGAYFAAGSTVAAINNGVVISGNDATGNGGGIFTATNLTVTNGSISYNTSTGGNGGGVCVVNAGNCSITNAEIYANTAPADTPDVSNGTSYASTGTTGNGGGIYVENTTVALSGCTVGKSEQPNMAVYGAGIAVFKGAKLDADNVNVNYNIAVKSGGGIFVLGSGANEVGTATTIDLSGGSVSYNKAESPTTKLPGDDGEDVDLTAEIGGGGLYIRGFSGYQDKGVTATIDNVTINENVSVRGGAIYLHEQSALTLKNCASVSKNNATQLGGVLFMTKGSSSADIDNCVFTENSAGLRGGCLYIQVNGCDVANSQMVGNKANGLSWGDGGKGGAIYVKNVSEAATAFDVNLTNVDFTENEAKYGAALCVADGTYPVTVNLKANASNDACNFNGNVAANNGGAILVSGTNAKVLMTEGHITGNTAGTTVSTVSPYQASLTTADGVGGGIAVFNGGTFSLTGSNIAIYGNTATTAGNDVFANGKNTSLTIPKPDAMNTTGFGKENAVWWEDYMSDDTNYGYGLNGDSRVIERYAVTPISIRAYTSTNEGTAPSGEYINDAGQYVAITFDVQKYNVGSIKITAPTATDENQRFVFTVSGKTRLDEDVHFTISLPAGESVTIAKMLPGTYTVTMENGWSWRYSLNGVTLDGVNTGNGTGTVEINVTGVEVDELYDVKYTANRNNPFWLDHNSLPFTNEAVPVSTTVANVYSLPPKKTAIV